MYWKTSVIILFISVFLESCAGITQTPVVNRQPTVTRIPPTAYPTQLTPVTPTTNFIPSFTPTSVSSSIYYMIVVDASGTMSEPFDGRTKMDAAREAIQDILAGLDPAANYGLVLLGGSPMNDESDSCTQPSVARIPFSAQSVVNSQIAPLQAAGGGSMYSAFVVARRQFETLPPETARVLIMITDTSDECQSQDEWKSLETLSKALDEVGLEFHSEIIILDQNENFGLRSTTDRIAIWSKGKVSFQFPQDISALQESQKAVIGNVSKYVENLIASRPSATPESLFFTLTPESGLPTNTLSASSYTLTPIPGLLTNTPGASSYTLTPKPGTATFTPTITFTAVPITATSTLTPTITRTPTSTAVPSVELISSSYRTTGIGCQVDIVVKVSGSPATGSFHVMNASNSPVGEVAQQVILPLGTYSNNIVSLSGNRPEYYFHEVWFEFNSPQGGQSNHLTNLKCPFVPTATPSS
jgi:hypothetical protein